MCIASCFRIISLILLGSTAKLYVVLSFVVTLGYPVHLLVFRAYQGMDLEVCFELRHTEVGLILG